MTNKTTFKYNQMSCTTNKDTHTTANTKLHKGMLRSYFVLFSEKKYNKTDYILLSHTFNHNKITKTMKKNEMIIFSNIFHFSYFSS